MRIGILGSGLMGGKLGTILARAGHEVVFSYARRNDKLKRFARSFYLILPTAPQKSAHFNKGWKLYVNARIEAEARHSR